MSKLVRRDSDKMQQVDCIGLYTVVYDVTFKLYLILSTRRSVLAYSYK